VSAADHDHIERFSSEIHAATSIARRQELEVRNRRLDGVSRAKRGVQRD
jgi:hypothetical protein